MRITGCDEQHPDDTDGFLGIVAAMAEAVGGGGKQLETPEMLVHLARRHAAANPGNDDHQQAADHETEERCDKDEGDDFQDTRRDQAIHPCLRDGSPDQPANQRMRGRGRNAVVPGDDVPDDGPDQGAENDVVIDDGRVDSPLTDGRGNLELKQEVGQKIERCCPDNRLVRLEHSR